MTRRALYVTAAGTFGCLAILIAGLIVALSSSIGDDTGGRPDVQRVGQFVQVDDAGRSSSNIDLRKLAEGACERGRALTDWRTVEEQTSTVGLAGRCAAAPMPTRWFAAADHKSAPADVNLAALLAGVCPRGGVDDWQTIKVQGTDIGVVGRCLPAGVR